MIPDAVSVLVFLVLGGAFGTHATLCAMYFVRHGALESKGKDVMQIVGSAIAGVALIYCALVFAG